MTPCPEIELLLSPAGRSAAAAHLSSCEACSAVAALADVRSERELSRDDPCIESEVRIALWHADLLKHDEEAELVSHLEHCAACNDLAVRVRALPHVTEESASARTLNEWVPPPTRQRRARRAWQPWTAIAAALVLVALVLVSIRLARRPTADVAPSPTPREVVSLPAGVPAPVPTPPVESAPIASTRPPPAPAPNPSPRLPETSELVDPFSAEPASTGYFTALCVPLCNSVLVDGKNRGPSPIVRLALPEGNHRVVFTHGTNRQMRSIHITRGQTTVLRVRMDPTSGDPGY